MTTHRWSHYSLVKALKSTEKQVHQILNQNQLQDSEANEWFDKVLNVNIYI